MQARHINFSLKNCTFVKTFPFKSYSASITSERGRIRSRIRILEAQKHAAPADPDPDPQHCCILQNFIFFRFGLKKVKSKPCERAGL